MGKHGRPFIIIATALFFITACNGLKRSGNAKPSGVLAIGVDTSDSTDTSKRCDEAAAQIHALLADRHLRRLDVLVLGTGDDATGGEPRVIVPWTTYAPSHDLYRTAAGRDHERLAWLAGIETACRAAIRPSASSPVYELVERSLTSIEAHCAELEHAGFACARKVLSLSSDLRSTYGAFGRYLKSFAKRLKKPPPAPKPFDLSGIEAHACGFSNTDAADGLPAAVVLRAWQAALGASIAIDPVCAVEPVQAEAAR